MHEGTIFSFVDAVSPRVFTVVEHGGRLVTCFFFSLSGCRCVCSLHAYVVRLGRFVSQPCVLPPLFQPHAWTQCTSRRHDHRWIGHESRTCGCFASFQACVWSMALCPRPRGCLEASTIQFDDDADRTIPVVHTHLRVFPSGTGSTHGFVFACSSTFVAWLSRSCSGKVARASCAPFPIAFFGVGLDGVGSWCGWFDSFSRILSLFFLPTCAIHRRRGMRRFPMSFPCVHPSPPSVQVQVQWGQPASGTD